ncbi:GNAT family N-acetyltransferase [Treponema primitia]|uniref:GNAT family N-acetyltransferase n=1 Tax=Treponema primitia TaxID=88058 RepID=UPI0002554DFF|nr:GNAT family N-acetyltransferase [Treponema primitia]
MQFELTEALIDDIVFTMENQEWISYLDTQEGTVVSEDDADLKNDDRDRYIDLPGWDSSDGYNLMEQFAAGFKNKVIRTKLSAALNRGKGVFRAFKDTLAEHPEAEKLWYAYKDREMKRAVIRWYNTLREAWGLESIGEEPEETEDLVQEDFRVREPVPEDAERTAELHKLCLAESPPPGAIPHWSFPGQLALVAETGSGDFAAHISGAVTGKSLEITALEVHPEYRGMGIGETLLIRLVGMAETSGVSEILIDVPQDAEGFSRVLLRESFTPVRTRYCRKNMAY